MPRKNKTAYTPEMRNVVLVRAAQVRALLVACINTSATPLTLAEMLALPDSKLQATGMNNEGINNQLRGLVKDGLISGTKRGVSIEYESPRKGPAKEATVTSLKSLQKSSLTSSAELNKLFSKRDALNAEIDKKVTELRADTIKEIVQLMQMYCIGAAELNYSLSDATSGSANPKEGKL